MAQLQLQQQQVANQQAEVMRNYEADKEELAQKYDANHRETQFKYAELLKELQFKYDELERKSNVDVYKTNINAETEEAKIVGDATTKIELKSLEGVEMPEEPEEETEEMGEEAANV